MNPHHSALRPASPRLLILAGIFALLASGPARAQILPAGPPQPYPETVYVRFVAPPPVPEDGVSWATAYTTLDPAISVVATGGQIWVAQGTYKPLSNTTGFSITKKLKLYGGFLGNEPSVPMRAGSFLLTILDGDIDGTDLGRADHVVSVKDVAGSSGTAGVVIDGFRIQHGHASSPGNSLDLNGAGIYSQCSDLDLANCFFHGNNAFNGGGLFFTGEGCSGGGFVQPKTLHIKLCEFGSSTNPDVDKNTADNRGGAIFAARLNGEIVNTTFLGNIANDYGGAVFLWRFWPSNRLDFTNCAFWRNHTTADDPSPNNGGGAMCLGETAAGQGAIAKLVNCTFAQNFTASCRNGIALNVSTHSTGMIYNSIFWHNFPTADPLCGLGLPPIVGNPTVDFSDVEGGWTPLGNNIFSNPQFVNPFYPQFDLRLSPGSFCLEVADLGRLPFDSLDVDGSGTTGEVMPIDLAGSARYVDDIAAPNLPPPANTWLDMGAYERQP